ncbi:unnamed protein product, partial [Mesorhabditis belari]|uniref:Uncharacterized protein n=1 Tax=Mesorhabditis belari TaxID=2138241 RepID=A0AAF3EQU3_9BILA
MPFINAPRERKSTYIDFEQPIPPSAYERISSSTASSSKSSVCPSSPGSLTSMSWFRSDENLYQSLPASSKEKRSRSPFKSPKKLVEPLYKICDALSRKCSFKRAGSPKPRTHEKEIDLPKPRMLDFESPEKWDSNNRVGCRELDLTPLCQMSPLEQKKSTINSRKLIIKRKSINEKSERKRDLRMMEGKIEDIDRRKIIGTYKNAGENVNCFGSVRERPNPLKYTDSMPTTSQKGYSEFTSPIARRPPSFTTSTPTRKPDGGIYKKKTPLSRHRSDAATLRQEHSPLRILSSPTKILYNSRRIRQAATRRNSMRIRQKNVLEVTYL